jgi:hypothetical protein
MKLSKPLCALILIALALLLSAARNAKATSPSPTPNQTPRASSGTQNPDDDERSPQATSSIGNRQSADQYQTPSATNTSDDRSEKYQEAVAHSAVVQAAFAVLLFFVTSLLAYIACQQWLGYRNLERGAMIIDNVELKDFLPESKLAPDEATYIVFRFRNIGRTPLRLVESKVQFRLATELVEPPDYGEHPLNMRGQILPQNESLFRMYRLYDPKLPRARLPDVTYDLVTSSNDVFLILYGYIRYIDVFGERHITGFGYQYGAAASIVSKRDEFLLYGSDAYNYTKKDRR